MVEPTISAGFARALTTLAVAKGASRKALCTHSGIAPAVLDDQDARVTLAKYIALMRAAKELSGDDALALHFGASFEIADLSIVGLIGQSCETMAEAFQQLDRFNRLVIDVPVDDPQGRRLVIAREESGVWIVDTRSDPNTFPELTESSFARMAAVSHTPPGQPRYVTAMHVTHPAPLYAAEYERVFQMPVIFNSDRNALLMRDDSFLTAKLPQPSRYVFGVLSARATALLDELERATSVCGKVESLLLPMLHTGNAGIDIIAGKMAMSRQTLFRRLKDEGTSFEKTLDGLRHKLALHYLSEKNISATEAAYLVGFSDPAAFSRAFKRWTGASPRAFRKAL